MPQYEIIAPTMPLVAGGNAYTTSTEDRYKVYSISGTETITGDNTFASTGTLADGIVFIYRYKAVAIYSGGVVRFHGVAMTATQALSQYLVVATYIGGAWDVDFIPDLSQNSIIEGTKLVDDTVPYEKIQETNSGDVLLGEATGAPDNIQEIPCTAAGRALLDDANAADQRTTLGLGTMSTQASGAVAITGGTVVGITDLAVADGGTGSSTAANARTALGFVSDVYTPTLTIVANIAAVTSYACNYVQVGTVITVSGKVDVDPTAAAPTTTQLRITLPVASNLTIPEQCAGTACAPTVAKQAGGIYGDTGNNEAILEFMAESTANVSWYFIFTYLVV